jgi:hypothetical protein
MVIIHSYDIFGFKLKQGALFCGMGGTVNVKAYRFLLLLLDLRSPPI